MEYERTVANTQSTNYGVLLSGGLDSAILLAHLQANGHVVHPFYIRGGLFWEPQELAAVRRFLDSLPIANRRELVVLELPLADLYRDHWSITGRDIPDYDSPDEAVFLPGRNALLIIKAALWCQLHDVPRLALAPLASNPFGDASDSFFRSYQETLSYTGRPIELLRPFSQMKKRDVMRLGRDYSLELTFSCISPVGDLHCGRCNKCAERHAAFRDAELPDRTRYATGHRRI